MIKTITINTDTHCVVPKGMVYELPGLPMPISKGEFSKDLFDGFQMHQYAMRYLDEAIAAAPQPEPVESEPNPNWCAGCSPDNCSGCRTGPVSKPDQTAELEQLRQQVADLEKERDELIEVKAAENASWNAGFNAQSAFHSSSNRKKTNDLLP